jgi:hypothetical protein
VLQLEFPSILGSDGAIVKTLTNEAAAIRQVRAGAGIR